MYSTCARNACLSLRGDNADLRLTERGRGSAWWTTSAGRCSATSARPRRGGDRALVAADLPVRAGPRRIGRAGRWARRSGANTGSSRLRVGRQTRYAALMTRRRPEAPETDLRWSSSSRSRRSIRAISIASVTKWCATPMPKKRLPRTSITRWCGGFVQGSAAAARRGEAPQTVGRASRVQGVTPAAISLFAGVAQARRTGGRRGERCRRRPGPWPFRDDRLPPAAEERLVAFAGLLEQVEP